MALEDISSWLSQDREISPELLTSVVEYWGDDERAEANIQEIMKNLLHNFPIKAGQIRFLGFTQDFLKLNVFALHALRLAAKSNRDAMRILGMKLIHKRGLEPDPAEGVRLLRQAIEEGDVKASAILVQS